MKILGKDMNVVGVVDCDNILWKTKGEFWRLVYVQNTWTKIRSLERSTKAVVKEVLIKL